MKKYSVLLFVGVFAGIITHNAEAVQVKPSTSTSWYVNATSSNESNSSLYSWMYSKGYAAGQVDLAAPGTQSSVVILDFFRPMVQSGVYGASGFGRFLSVSVIKESARQFAYGYWMGTGSDYDSQMRMVIGTSNDNVSGSVTYTHGQVWVQLVKDIGAQLQSYGYASQVSVRGGIDVEPGYSSSGTAISWVNGYASGFVAPYYLYNYGSADGCPQSGTSSTPGVCATKETIQKGYTWSQDDIQYVSYGAQPSYPLPEIYATSGGNAKSWQQLSLYSYLRYGYAMFNTAPLSQSQACAQKGGCSGINNTPQQAWDQFWTQLNNDYRTAQDFWWSTDIKWRQ